VLWDAGKDRPDLGVPKKARRVTMTFDLPEFLEEMAREGAAAEYTDLATYIMLLIIRDDERRRSDAARAAAERALPAVSEEVRQRALKKVLALRAQRETGIPPTSEP
jgi:hypothetical protein